MNLCQYKDIFGKSREGAHSFRILDIAMVDFLATIALAYLFSYLFKVNVWYVLIFLLVISVFLHKLFCVETTFTKFIYG